MENKKRIVQVLYSGMGGHGTVALSLLKGFTKNNLANYFIFYGIEPLNEHYKKVLRNNPDVLRYDAIKKRTKLGVKEWIAYYKFLKNIKPHIILQHSPQLILVSFLYRLFHKAKIITVEHDAISIRTKTKWMVTNLNAILANKIVVLNDQYKKHIKSNLWFSTLIKKYVVIPNGINSSKYKQKEKYFQKKEITIFMASRMNKLRDHKTLIEAVTLAYKENTNIRLRIAGDGDTLTGLKRIYEGLFFISFLGNISESSIIKELHLADIYIHATFAETFSTAILQAMSVGLPIIVSDIEGTRHMINTNNGVLYQSENIDDLFLKTQLLINNKEKAILLGKKARKDVVNKYTINKVTESFLKLF